MKLFQRKLDVERKIAIEMQLQFALEVLDQFATGMGEQGDITYADYTSDEDIRQWLIERIKNGGER